MKVELLRKDEEFYKMWLQNVVTKCGSQLVQFANPHHDGLIGEGGVYFTRSKGHLNMCNKKLTVQLLTRPIRDDLAQER